MRLPWVVVAFLVIWGVIDRWPFRWLAWLWLITVSLPFVTIAIPMLLIEVAIARLRGLVQSEAVSTD